MEMFTMKWPRFISHFIFSVLAFGCGCYTIQLLSTNQWRGDLPMKWTPSDVPRAASTLICAIALLLFRFCIFFSLRLISWRASGIIWCVLCTSRSMSSSEHCYYQRNVIVSVVHCSFVGDIAPSFMSNDSISEMSIRIVIKPTNIESNSCTFNCIFSHVSRCRMTFALISLREYWTFLISFNIHSGRWYTMTGETWISFLAKYSDDDENQKKYILEVAGSSATNILGTYIQYVVRLCETKCRNDAKCHWLWLRLVFVNELIKTEGRRRARCAVCLFSLRHKKSLRCSRFSK